MVSNQVYQRCRGLLHLYILQALIPFTLTYMLCQFIRYLAILIWVFITKKKKSQATFSLPNHQISRKSPVTVVLTGGKMTKSLHMARCLWEFARSQNLQFRIIVAESKKFRYSATRYSRCVDRFYVVTSARVSSQRYMDDIVRICQHESATYFIPVSAPVESIWDSTMKPRLEKECNCRVLHMDAQLCGILDNKQTFSNLLRDTLQMQSSLPSVLIKDEANAINLNKQLLQSNPSNMKMVLKNLEYDPIHRLDLFLLPTKCENLTAYLRKLDKDGNKICEKHPWQAQQFVTNANEYAVMIVVRNNVLLALSCCPSSSSQLNYAHCDVPVITNWIKNFLQNIKYKTSYVVHGQLCFDMLVESNTNTNNQIAYPIECNPRIHTLTTVYCTPHLKAMYGAALLSSGQSSTSLELMNRMDKKLSKLYGENGKCNVFWMYNELFKIYPYNNWLLKYNANDACHSHDKQWNIPSTYAVFALLIYAPALLFMLVCLSPIIIISIVCSIKNMNSIGIRITYNRMIAFIERLCNLSGNIEADFCISDPLPFFAKNHIQVPSRLCSVVYTGVTWKKVDFAIGKVVQVGGD